MNYGNSLVWPWPFVTRRYSNAPAAKSSTSVAQGFEFRNTHWLAQTNETLVWFYHLEFPHDLWKRHFLSIYKWKSVAAWLLWFGFGVSIFKGCPALLDAPFQSWSWCTWFCWWSAQPKQFPQRRRPMSTGVRPSSPWWSSFLLHRIPWRKLRTRCWSHPLSTQPRTRGRWATCPRDLSRPERALWRSLRISQGRPRHDNECLKMSHLGQAFPAEWSSLLRNGPINSWDSGEKRWENNQFRHS